jgi:hypothetical protein
MIELNTERMHGMGPCNVDNFQINLLYGLNDLCEKFLQKDFRILELGSNDGVSTSLFSTFVKEVVCVDINMSTKMVNTLEKYTNIIFHRMSFENFISMDSNNLYDFIYIDGNHDYDSINRDIENFKHKVKKGGYISGHDFNSNTSGVEMAVRNNFSDKEVFIFSDSSWLIKI